jgi:hypothetical protein
MALRESLREYLHSTDGTHELAEMILDNAEPTKMPEWRMAS